MPDLGANQSAQSPQSVAQHSDFANPYRFTSVSININTCTHEFINTSTYLSVIDCPFTSLESRGVGDVGCALASQTSCIQSFFQNLDRSEPESKFFLRVYYEYVQHEIN